MLIPGSERRPTILALVRQEPRPTAPYPVGTVGSRWNRGLIDFSLLLALVKPIRSHSRRKLYSSQGKLERADRWK